MTDGFRETLATFANQFPGRDYSIEIRCPEFTIDGAIPMPAKFSPWHDLQPVARTFFAFSSSSLDISSRGDFILSSL